MVERQRQRRDRTITITRDHTGAWRVSGGAIERMVVQTDWENDEAVLYLQHRFERIGLDEKLAKHGAKQGDEVRILGFEFTYEGETEDDYTELDEAVELFDDADGEEE